MVGTEQAQDNATRSLALNIGATTSDARLERIQDIAAKLLDSTVLNTVQSRGRCRQLAVAMLQLLDEEDARQSRLSRIAEDNRAAKRRFKRTIRAFRETVEQARASRLNIVSQRLKRTRGQPGEELRLIVEGQGGAPGRDGVQAAR